MSVILDRAVIVRVLYASGKSHTPSETPIATGFPHRSTRVPLSKCVAPA